MVDSDDKVLSPLQARIDALEDVSYNTSALVYANLTSVNSSISLLYLARIRISDHYCANLVDYVARMDSCLHRTNWRDS
jgi:hypothetical protein